MTLLARFIAGMSAGVVWGLVAGYARRLAPAHLQGRALAIVGVGQPIALSLGVPLGSWLGSLFDWRMVFWIMSALALLILTWVRLGIPDFPGQDRNQRLPVRQVFLIPGVRPILLVLFTWIAIRSTREAIMRRLSRNMRLVRSAIGTRPCATPIPSSSTIIIRSGRSLEKLDGSANSDQEDGDRNSVPHTSVASEKSFSSRMDQRG